VRWALEEAGLRYEARFIDPAIQASPEYRALQPFGQVPSFEEEGLKLFETGAILLHVASRSDALLPTDPTRRARAIAWVFAALNSMEPSIQQLAEIDFFYPGQEWTKAHRPHIEARVKQRLGELANWLGNREYLEDHFTAGDLMMTTVLRILRHTDLVEEEPRVKAYKERCEARLAFQRALRAQMADFAQ
jgi:glutathione S-transferase